MNENGRGVKITQKKLSQNPQQQRNSIKYLKMINNRSDIENWIVNEIYLCPLLLTMLENSKSFPLPTEIVSSLHPPLKLCALFPQNIELN